MDCAIKIMRTMTTTMIMTTTIMMIMIRWRRMDCAAKTRRLWQTGKLFPQVGFITHYHEDDDGDMTFLMTMLSCGHVYYLEYQISSGAGKITETDLEIQMR